MKKNLTALLLAVILMFTVAISAQAYDSEIASGVRSNYSKALSIAGRSSFHGNCNLATAYQLQAMGIYKNSLDYSGTGSSWYSHFSSVQSTTGGYKVVTISGANCLYDLIDKYGDTLYNIVYSLGTGGSSGSNHVLFIRAIIDGQVYFADSFGCTYGGTYYPEGSCTVLSLSKFISSYREMNGNPYGCVYFTSSSAQHLEGSAQAPEQWEQSDRSYETGEYTVKASMLRIREKPGTGYESVGLIANGETVSVTEIKDNWGKVSYEGSTGWICLDYAVKISATSANPDTVTSQLMTAAGQLRVANLSADKNAVNVGDAIVWTADAEGGNSSSYFYAFYIYKDGVQLYAGTYSASNTISYVVTEEGTYQACVFVVDSDNNKADSYSDETYAVTDINSLLAGDADGDGIVTSADARFALRAAAKMEALTGKSFICADVNGDGVIAGSDARLILRKAAALDEIV